MNVEKINKLIENILDTGTNFWDNPNGGYVFSCPFCNNSKEVKGGEYVSISELVHDMDCIYIQALDLQKDVERSMKLENINKK